MSFGRFTHATLAVVVLAAVTLAAQPQTPKPWDEIPLTVPIVHKAMAYVPKHPVSSVFLFISGDGGWELGVVDMARRIMPKAIVIGISYPALKTAQGVGTQCWQPAGSLEEIAHAAERALKLPEYYPPILLGYSSGATAVYAGLAGAPPQTFSGGLSLGFCPDLPSLRPVCNADNFKPTFDAKKNTAWLPKVASVPKDWFVLNGNQDQVCLPPDDAHVPRRHEERALHRGARHRTRLRPADPLGPAVRRCGGRADQDRDASGKGRDAEPAGRARAGAPSRARCRCRSNTAGPSSRARP